MMKAVLTIIAAGALLTGCFEDWKPMQYEESAARAEYCRAHNLEPLHQVLRNGTAIGVQCIDKSNGARYPSQYKESAK